MNISFYVTVFSFVHYHNVVNENEDHISDDEEFMSNGNSPNSSDYEGREYDLIISEDIIEERNTFQLGETSRWIEGNYVEIN